MDNVTHALHGFALAAVAATEPAIAQDPTAMSAVLWAVSLGSQAPDFDFVIRLFAGDVAYLRHHRGISHSIPAWFLWPTFLAAILSIFHPGYFGLLWLWSFYGVLTHVGMDLLTTYGTTAFWPFYKRRIGWDILMIVDVVIWVFGGIGLLLWARGFTPQQVLLYTVLPSLLYIALRTAIMLYLRQKVRARFPEETIHHISVIPFLGLFRWNLVVEFDHGFCTGTAHLRKGIHIDGTFDQLPVDELLALADNSEVYRTFRWFARHLFVKARREADGSIHIDMSDLAFRFHDRLPFTAHIVLDPQGRVLSERLGRKRVKKAQQKAHNVI